MEVFVQQLMTKKFNILFLDFDDVLNSVRSFFKKFAEYHGIPWTEEDFSPKYWDGENPDSMNPSFHKKVIEAWQEQSKKDGYVHPELSMYNWPPDEEAIKNLNKIIEENKAKVVICSSWRHSKGNPSLQKILDSWGAKCQVIGKTSVCQTRGLEILEWVISNRKKIKGICILDDSASMDIDYIFSKWCVPDISGYKHGLRDIHVPIAKKCFETPIFPLSQFKKWIWEYTYKKIEKRYL